jgi:hypothetical protein
VFKKVCHRYCPRQAPSPGARSLPWANLRYLRCFS